MQGHGKNYPLLLLSVPNISNVKEIQQQKQRLCVCVCSGINPPEGDVTPVYRRADWSAVPEHWE